MVCTAGTNTDDWSPADHPCAITVPEAQWWQRTAALAVLRLRGDDDRLISWFRSRQIDARQLVFALRQILNAERLEQVALSAKGTGRGVAWPGLDRTRHDDVLYDPQMTQTPEDPALEALRRRLDSANAKRDALIGTVHQEGDSETRTRRRLKATARHTLDELNDEIAEISSQLAGNPPMPPIVR